MAFAVSREGAGAAPAWSVVRKMTLICREGLAAAELRPADDSILVFNVYHPAAATVGESPQYQSIPAVQAACNNHLSASHFV